MYHTTVWLYIDHYKKRQLHPSQSLILSTMPKRSDIIAWLACPALSVPETKCRILRHTMKGDLHHIEVIVVVPPLWIPLYSYFNEHIGYVPYREPERVMNQLGYLFDTVPFHYETIYRSPYTAWKIESVDVETSVILMTTLHIL